MCILPQLIISELEKIMRGFLWCQGPMKSGKAKVAWKDLCLPRQEGGLGIHRLREWNISLMTKHIWSILTRKDSIWVRWVYAYKLNNRSFWDVPPQNCMSWGWRNLLNIRDLIRPFCWYQIGDGRTASVWYDTWCVQCPIARVFSCYRDITRQGFSVNDSVADLIDGDVWRWPNVWIQRYPIFSQIVVPIISDHPDKLFWRDGDGNFSEFRVSEVWESIRTRCSNVAWASVVWFPQCIPRHAFNMWLVFKGKLKTQDRLRQWDVGPSVDLNLLRCYLCGSCLDSHSHLFFECVFSSQVWFRVVSYADIPIVSDKLEDVIPVFISASSSKNVDHVISRLLLAATTYFIWQERNLRLFAKGRRSSIELADIILSEIRLKLVSFRFRSSFRATRVLERWKIPSHA